MPRIIKAVLKAVLKAKGDPNKQGVPNKIKWPVSVYHIKSLVLGLTFQAVKTVCDPANSKCEHLFYFYFF